MVQRVRLQEVHGYSICRDMGHLADVFGYFSQSLRAMPGRFLKLGHDGFLHNFHNSLLAIIESFNTIFYFAKQNTNKQISR
jgi:hypothetical protein